MLSIGEHFRDGSAKIPGSQAGYMELTGAKKNGDCSKVEVAGGVSRDRGCCNKFEPRSKSVQLFNCGHCEYVTEK